MEGSGTPGLAGLFSEESRPVSSFVTEGRFIVVKEPDNGGLSHVAFGDVSDLLGMSLKPANK